MTSDWLVWTGILLCVCHSAVFSGLNLAFFSVSRLRLEAEAPHNPRAQVVLAMRKDSNFLLTTILWGNVSVNTLLALLSNSVLTGLAAFVFSTLIITFFGEICPQAFFSRRALQTAARFAPILRFYQILLLPVAKPTAKLLDLWLGKETIQLMREQTLRDIIHRHVQSGSGEIDKIEGLGALNFLDMDDMVASGEGQPLSPDSIIILPTANGELVMPHFVADKTDPFLHQVHASGMKWVILTDQDHRPRLILNADQFLRDMMLSSEALSPLRYCHEPIVVEDSATPLGDVIAQIKFLQDGTGITMERDVALLWNDNHRRVITGSDILMDLLRDTRGGAPLPSR